MKDLLTQLISGGLAGILAWKLIELVPSLATLEDDLKRYAAFAVTILLGAAAYAVTVGMRFNPPPADAVEWIKALGDAGLAAYASSQMTHAATALRLKRQVKAMKKAALRKNR